MNYRTVTDEQLRAERVRLTNMIQLVERRRDASTVHRGGRDAGFRRPASTHQQERELVQLRAQLDRLDKELAWRADHAKAAAERSPAAAKTDAAEA